MTFKGVIDDIFKCIDVDEVAFFMHNEVDYNGFLLYATKRGVPFLRNPPRELFKRIKNNVMMMLIIYLLIWSYSEKQSFVQLSIDSFLTMINKMPRE